MSNPNRDQVVAELTCHTERVINVVADQLIALGSKHRWRDEDYKEVAMALLDLGASTAIPDPNSSDTVEFYYEAHNRDA